MTPAKDLRRSRAEPYAGKEILEIQPVLLGGKPEDPTNHVLLTRKQHIEAVRYWNRVIRERREESAR